MGLSGRGVDRMSYLTRGEKQFRREGGWSETAFLKTGRGEKDKRQPILTCQKTA